MKTLQITETDIYFPPPNETKLVHMTKKEMFKQKRALSQCFAINIFMKGNISTFASLYNKALKK